MPHVSSPSLCIAGMLLRPKLDQADAADAHYISGIASFSGPNAYAREIPTATSTVSLNDQVNATKGTEQKMNKQANLIRKQ